MFEKSAGLLTFQTCRCLRLAFTAVAFFNTFAACFPSTNSTDSTLIYPAVNGFPFHTQFEGLVQEGIRHLKQTFPAIEMHRIFAAPKALPWVHDEFSFELVDIYALNHRSRDRVKQLNDRDAKHKWLEPWEDPWPRDTPYRTWSVSDWRMSLKKALEVIEDHELPPTVGYSLLQVIRWKWDKLPPKLHDELHFALERQTESPYKWVLVGMKTETVALANFDDNSNALVNISVLTKNATLNNVQTS